MFKKNWRHAIFFVLLLSLMLTPFVLAQGPIEPPDTGNVDWDTALASCDTLAQNFDANRTAETLKALVECALEYQLTPELVVSIGLPGSAPQAISGYNDGQSVCLTVPVEITDSMFGPTRDLTSGDFQFVLYRSGGTNLEIRANLERSFQHADGTIYEVCGWIRVDPSSPFVVARVILPGGDIYDWDNDGVAEDGVTPETDGIPVIYEQPAQ